MLRLNLSTEPEWLDLGSGVRVRVAPLTSALMARARASDAIEALVAALASEAELAVALATVLAAMAIVEWEGIGDAEGEPLPVSPEAASALMDVYPVFESFQLRYVAKGLVLDAEKNASAPSPNGISEGAPPIAEPARRAAKSARRG